MTTPTEADQATPTDPSTKPEDGGQEAASPTSSSSPRFAQRIKTELLLGLEIAALTALTFTRPILDVFGRSPETFVSRGATTATIVLFGLSVAFLPLLVCVLVGVGSGVLGPTVRRGVHLGLVALLAGLAANRFGQDQTGWPFDATKLLLAGVVVGAAVGLARWKLAAVGAFLRYAGVAGVLFLAQFLVASPTADVAFGSGPRIDAAVAEQVAAGLGADPPDVVVVVLDALPTAALLDGSGHLDADLFPNLASLADTSTWYRNNTTVAGFTGEAVPALMTGRYPVGDFEPDKNLFTLLGGSYDVYGKEQVTRLCPDELCPRTGSGGLDSLVGDAASWWAGNEAGAGNAAYELPIFSDVGAFPLAEGWIDDLRVSPGGRPDLTFLHIELPHPPWRYLDDGTEYVRSETPYGSFGVGWTESGVDVGRQRLLLQAQAADLLVGNLLDKLRDAGTFDNTLFVLTADHGESTLANAPMRALTETTVPYVMWTPLFVKAPGQTSAEVDDGNVQSIDIFPTIADMLGIELPWDVDGMPVSEASDERDPEFKRFADNELFDLDVPTEDGLLEVPAAEPFGAVLAGDYTPFAAGPDSVWQRTVHGELLGRGVDDLDIGEPTQSTEGRVPLLEEYAEVDLDEPLPIELFAWTDLDLGTFVAFALNGTIAAVAEVEPPPSFDRGGPDVHVLARPDELVDGVNELTAFVVEGEVGAEVLHPLTLRN